MVMDYLNEHGHDINVQDFSGCTPLAWLTMSKQVSDLPHVRQWQHAVLGFRV